MKRIALLLFLSMMVVTVLATLAQEQQGESDGSAVQAPVPNSPPAESKTVAGILVATPSNSIVIRSDSGKENTFHVESSSLLPRSMRVGERIIIVYHELPGQIPEALEITQAPAMKAPGSRGPKSVSTAASTGRSTSGMAGASARSTARLSAGAASTTTEGSHGPERTLSPGASVPEGGKPGKTAATASGTSGVGTAPGSSATGSATTSGAAPKTAESEAAESTGHGTSTQQDGLFGMSRTTLLPILCIGGILVLGLAFGLWSYFRKAD